MPLPLALTLVVLLAGGDGREAAVATTRTLERALGQGATLVVREVGDRPSDAELRRIEAELHAESIGVVTWADGRRRATIRVHRTTDDRWLERDVQFAPQDVAAERSRAVAFTIVAMLPEELPGVGRATPSSTSVPPVPPPSPPTAPPVAAPSARPDGAAGRDAPSSPEGTSGPSRPVAPMRLPRFSLDALVVGAAGIDGPAGGLGGMAAGGLALGRHGVARLAASARFGAIDEVQVTTSTLGAALGLGYQAWVDAARRWQLGARVDALVLWHRATHFSGDDLGPITLARWLPGVDAAFEVAMRLTEGSALLAGFGAEVALGRTDLYLHGIRRTTIPPLRLFGEIGVRILF